MSHAIDLQEDSLNRLSSYVSHRFQKSLTKSFTKRLLTHKTLPLPQC